MTLGPNTLDPSACDQILADAEYTQVLADYAAATIPWGHASLAALKMSLRESLRQQQVKRCIFCRRIILKERRNAAEDIEHFLDKSKSKYFKWSFESRNLSLACHPCNMQKSTTDVAVASVGTSLVYVSDATKYRWLHPYFDEYHSNITIGRGWTYVVNATAPAPVRAQNMIDECKLEEVSTTEAYAEAIKLEIHRLTCAVGAAIRDKNMDLALLLNDECEIYQNESWFDF